LPIFERVVSFINFPVLIHIETWKWVVMNDQACLGVQVHFILRELVRKSVGETQVRTPLTFT
jgi:hypothetical protein